MEAPVHQVFAVQNNKGQNLYYGNRYTPYKQNIKFYIAEPKTPLDNQLQYKNHIVRNLSLPRPSKPRTKRNFGHPKVTTTRRNSWKINRLNNQSNIKSQYNPINYYITETTIRRTYYKLSITVVTKNT